MVSVGQEFVGYGLFDDRDKKCTQDFDGELLEKRLIRRVKGCKDNTKTDFGEKVCEVVEKDSNLCPNRWRCVIIEFYYQRVNQLVLMNL